MSRPAVDPVRLSQIEILVNDLAKSIRFYSDAFGWRPVPAEFHEMVLLEVPRDCPFGISLRPTAATDGTGPQRLTLYFTVDDPESTLERVVNSGGRKIPTTLKLPGYGLVQLCEDPDGIRFGLFKRASAPV